MIKAVLFDANKTIEDYNAIKSHQPAIFHSMAEHICSMGQRILESDIKNIYDEFRALYGNSSWEYYPVFWRTLVHRTWISSFTDTEINNVYNRFLDFYTHTIKLHDDVLPTLSLLRKSYRLALVANGNADRLCRLVSMFKLHDFFECVAVSGECPFTKPDPFLFKYALNELQVHPEEAVMVGDRFTTDIAGARALGIRTIHLSRQAYTSEIHGKPWLCPDADIRSVVEIPSLLNDTPTSWASLASLDFAGSKVVTDALVVCGGKGSRMAALTSDNQKCLLPLGGIPMLDYVIRSLVAVGCKRVFFLLGHCGDLVKHFVGNGKSFGINPVFLNGPFNGTLHSIVSCISAVSETFYYLHANVIYPTRLLEMLWSRHSETQEPQVVVVHTPRRIAHIRIQTHNNGLISKIDTTTHKGSEYGDLFLGVALYDKTLFSQYDGYSGQEMTEVAVEESINNGKRIWALPFEGRWRHYETEEDYNADANYTPSQLVGW